MTVKAKFYVGTKEITGVNNPQAVNMTKVTLLPVINGSDENKKFWQYTPAGKIELQTINEEAATQFEVGKEYYVEFTPAVQELKELSETVKTVEQPVTQTFVCPDTLK